jgi:hypothetical protein
MANYFVTEPVWSYGEVGIFSGRGLDIVEQWSYGEIHINWDYYAPEILFSDVSLRGLTTV